MKKSFIIHHTGGSNKKPLADTAHHTFSMVNSYHKERFKKFKSKLGYYIGYHYYIEKSGVVTQGRAVNEVGAHTYGYNQHIGVCLAGNFDRDIETANSHPTKKQLESLRELYNDLVKRNIIEENKRGIWFHRDIANKTCPGLNMNKQMIVNYLLNNNNIKILNIELFYPSSISKKEEKGIKQAMENVKELIQENTSSSLILNFNLKLIPLKPINIYWQGNTIKRSWFDINILTKTNNNTDIVMLMLPKEYWLSRKYLGYVHADKRHGVSIGAMKVQVDATRTKNGELMDRDYNSTILLHEITHILYAMNNKPFLKDKEKQKQRLPNIDNTHYFDYYVDDKDLRFPLFWEIETNRLNTKPNNLLYKGVGQMITYTERELHEQHIRINRRYRTQDSLHFFKYQKNGWGVSNEDDYNESNNRQIITDYNARWIYNLLNIKPNKNISKAVRSTVPQNRIIRLLLLAIGWKKNLNELK